VNRRGTTCSCTPARCPFPCVNTSRVRLSNRDRARNKRDGGQSCFHVSFPFPVAEPFSYNLTQTVRNEKRFSSDPFGIIGSEEHRRRMEVLRFERSAYASVKVGCRSRTLEPTESSLRGRGVGPQPGLEQLH